MKSQVWFFLFLLFLAFPKNLLAVETPNPVTDRFYTGQIKDDTGLYYYNARYYDPQLGIFTSADKAQGPNRYAYVGGNPIMRNDPSGNQGVTPYQYKPPLKRWTNYYNPTLQGGARVAIGLGAALVSGQPAVGVFAYAASLGLLPWKINEKIMASESFQRYESAVYQGTNFEAENDLVFVSSLTKSVFSNTTYNKRLKEAAWYEEESMWQPWISRFGSNFAENLASSNAICEETAVYLHYLLGKQGIESHFLELVRFDPIGDIRESKRFNTGIRFGEDILTGHFAVTFRYDGGEWVADPTAGTVTPIGDYLKDGYYNVALERSFFYDVPSELKLTQMYSGLYKAVLGKDLLGKMFPDQDAYKQLFGE